MQKEGVNMQSAHARQCLREVRTCRRLVPGLTFDLHFGAILETKFATILLSGRPGPQKGVKKAMEKKGKKTFMRRDARRRGYGEGMALEKHQPPSTQDQDQDRDPGLSLRTEANQRTTQRHSPRFRASAVADKITLK